MAEVLALAWRMIRVGIVAFGVVKLVAWAWIMGPHWMADAKRWWVQVREGRRG